MQSQLAELVDDYQPTNEAVELVSIVPKIFLVGIAAAGKNLILGKLLETGKFYEIVTYTTRLPRSNSGKRERNGREYFFVDTQKAISMLRKKKFVEAKWIHRQNLYGTTISEYEKAKATGKIALSDIDVRGVEEYMKISPKTTKPIFILPPNFETWQQRFKARYEGRLGEGEFSRRALTAAEEIKHVLSKDYYHIVINDDLQDAVTQVLSIANGETQPDAAKRHGLQVAHELLDSIKNTR